MAATARLASLRPGALALALLVLVPSLARADGDGEVAARLDAAEAAEAALDYDVALIELQQVIADPRANDLQLVKAHYRAGLICRVLDKNVEAEQHLKAALRKNPDLLPPPGASPKIVSFFKTVRGSVQAELDLNQQIVQAKRDREVAERERAEAEKLRDEAAAPSAGPETAVDDGALSAGVFLLAGGGALAVAGGFAMFLAGGAAAGVFGIVVADSSQPADTRNIARTAAYLLAGGTGLAAVLAAVGGGLAVTGLFVE